MSGVLKKIKTEPNDSAYYKTVKIKKEPTDWSQCKTVKIKTEPSVKIKTEPSVKIKTEPSVKIKTEPSVKIKTEPSVKIKTEPSVKTKKEPKDEKPLISESGATAATLKPGVKRRTTTRKSTTKRKFKTRRKRTTKLGKKRKTRRKKRRTTKKSRPTSRSLPPSADARTRITSKLGIGPPPKSPYGLPTIKNNQSDSLSTSDLRAAAGISRLSLFGTELDTYDPPVSVEERSDDANVQNATNVDSLTRRQKKRIVSPVKKERSVPSHKKVATNSSVDLLGEIMQSQVKLHTSSRDITITRDGSVLLKTDSLVKRSPITSNKVLNTVNTKPNVFKCSETVKIKTEPDDSKHCKSVTIKKELNDHLIHSNAINVKKEQKHDLTHSSIVKIKKEPKDSEPKLVDEKVSNREYSGTEVMRKPNNKRKEQDDTIYYETVTIKAEKEYSTFHKKLKTEQEIPVITLD